MKRIDPFLSNAFLLFVLLSSVFSPSAPVLIAPKRSLLQQKGLPMYKKRRIVIAILLSSFDYIHIPSYQLILLRTNSTFHLPFFPSYYCYY